MKHNSTNNIHIFRLFAVITILLTGVLTPSPIQNTLSRLVNPAQAVVGDLKIGSTTTNQLSGTTCGVNSFLQFDSTGKMKCADFDTAFQDKTPSFTDLRVAGNVTFAPMIKDMVAYFPFDEASGNVIDQQSLIGGTATGTTVTVGKIGSGRNFNGSSDFITTGDPADNRFDLPANMSLSIWVKFTALPSNNFATFMSKDAGGGSVNKWFFGYSGGTYGCTNAFGFHINTAAGSSAWICSNAVTPTLNQWYHVALTKNGNSYAWYVNGSASGTPSNAVAIPDVNFALLFGRAEGSFYFNGVLDEAGKWNRALSSTEIGQLYNGGNAYQIRNTTHSMDIPGEARVSGNLYLGPIRITRDAAGQYAHVTGNSPSAVGKSYYLNNGTLLGSIYGSTGSDGGFGLLSSSGTWAVRIQQTFNQVNFPGDLRAHAMYDSSNAAFYIDPATRMKVNVINVSQICIRGTCRTTWPGPTASPTPTNTPTPTATPTLMPRHATNGSGKDGAITIAAGKNINVDNMATGRSCADGGDGVNYAITANVSAGATSFSLSSTPAAGCLASNDEILIMNVQGTSGDNANAGKYEFGVVTGVNGATINVSQGLTNAYNGTTQKIMVQRVPNYTNVTINSSITLTANAWNGTKGGVIAFRANGTTTNNGTISANALGYRAGNTYNGNTPGYKGEFKSGPGLNSPVDATLRNANGGGGGNANDTASGYHSGLAEGGGGGAYGTGGTNGSYSNVSYQGSGLAGSAHGVADLSLLLPGSAGGVGGAGYNGAWFNGNATTDGKAGNGGGIIYIGAATFTNSGTVSANGANGNHGWGHNGSSCGQQICGGGGGGGAGGSIYITGTTATLGSNTITATGGIGGNGGGGSYGQGWNGTVAGNGGVGRIYVGSTTVVSGSTNPVHAGTPAPTNTPTPTPLAFPSSGLTAYWKMNEGSTGLAVDYTGGDDGTDAATGVGTGKIGNGRVYNGTNSRITVGNTAGVNITGAMTISAWINPDNADSTHRNVAIKWGEGTRQYFFARDAGNKMSVWLSPDGSTGNLGIRQSSSTITANVWTHVVMTYTPGTSINIYINGALNNGTLTGTVPGSLFNGGAPMYLGPYPDQTWKGMMDEVGIWNRALSAGEISNLYNGGAGLSP
jgi:hypothetical protein